MLKQTVFSITEATLSQQLGFTPDKPMVEQVSKLLHQKLTGMSTFLGGGMIGVTLLFEAAPVLNTGRPFHKLNLDERQRRLKAMKNAPINVLRDFVTFYEKMGLFAYYCQVEEQMKAQEGGEQS